MKVTAIVLLLIAIYAVLAIAEPLTEVKVFNDDNFYSFIEQNPKKRIMMKFYAPWCGHCRAMAQDYITAAADNDEDDYVFGEVDCTTSRALCKAFDVKGYPTLKVIHNGKHIEHSGGRTAAALVESLKTAKPTNPIMIARPPAIQTNEIIAAIIHDLKEMFTLRLNATLLILVASFALGYVVRSSTSSRPSKKTKKD